MKRFARTVALPACFISILLSACTVTRQGTLEEVNGTLTLPVTASVASDSAWLRVVDPRTGEVLQGRLSLDPGGRHNVPSPHPQPALPSGSGGLGAAGAGVPLRGGTVLNLTGLLHGDQGMTLACAVQVEQRIRLRGTGLCQERREGASSTFRLRF